MNHPNLHPSISEKIANSEKWKKIKKSDIKKGQRLIVKTTHSTYEFDYLGNNEYMVKGGYFDINNLSPCRVIINGCTWGGSMLKIDVVAVENMYMEMRLKKEQKTVTTSKIISASLK